MKNNRLLTFTVLILIAREGLADECPIVRGYNLCDDAATIAANTRADVGKRIAGSEYVLTSVSSEHVTVITNYQSIYREELALQAIERQMPPQTNFSAYEVMLRQFQQSFDALCTMYSKDEFVVDGGRFRTSYYFQDDVLMFTLEAQGRTCQLVDGLLKHD